jgi:hypothetical protein
MSLFSILLPIHSIVRWLVVVAALAVVGRAFYGWLTKKDWTALDDRLGMIFPMTLDIQVLVGLILYFFASPITLGALSNFGAAMRAGANTRFFVLEHGVMMLIALVLAHIGRARTRKVVGAVAKHRTAAIFFGLAVLALLYAIPWSRPLLPFGS